MRSLLYAACCALLFLQACTVDNVRTANPEAAPEARKLLEFLYEIQGRYILSGQHNFIATGSKYSDLVQEHTGSFPIVWGSDFSFCYEGKEPIRFQYCGPINLPDPDTVALFETMQSLKIELTDLTPDEARRRLVETVIAKHREGCIITLMWHACPPGFGDTCDGERIWSSEDRMSPKEWEDLTTEGTRLNNAWKVQADTIALYLKQLRDERVPVLWRPYHEMNGEVFWWSNRPGENGFKKLWIMMFDYFVNHHGLDNLLWVWNPETPRDVEGDKAYAYEKFWPGEAYVDILAADVSRDDWEQSYYDKLVSLAAGKPVAIGTAVPPPDVQVLESQRGWTWFMTWGNRVLWGNGIDRFKELYESGSVLALKDVIIEEGTYKVVGRPARK